MNEIQFRLLGNILFIATEKCLELYTYKSINCLHVIYHIVPITKQLNSNNLKNVESFKLTWHMKCRSRLVVVLTHEVSQYENQYPHNNPIPGIVQ